MRSILSTVEWDELRVADDVSLCDFGAVYLCTLVCTKCIWRTLYWKFKKMMKMNSFTVSGEFEHMT